MTTVNDEYNVDDIMKNVGGVNNFLILGKDGGVRKTTLAVKFGTKIISPYKALCQENNICFFFNVKISYIILV